MFIGDVISSGAVGSLELTLRFAGQRQALLAHNVANLNTPNFTPTDVSTEDFRRTLERAIRDRRAGGPLEWKQTRELRKDGAGELRLVPRTRSANILFHDRNNRDLERLMQSLAENTQVFRIAADLLRTRHQHMREAIAERV